MKAAVYYENGPPSVFKYENVPDPQPNPQSIIIRSRRFRSKAATRSIGSAARW